MRKNRKKKIKKKIILLFSQSDKQVGALWLMRWTLDLETGSGSSPTRGTALCSWAVSRKNTNYDSTKLGWCSTKGFCWAVQ